MTALLYTHLPKDADPAYLADRLLLGAGPQNAAYIQALANQQSKQSAAESLTALALLFQALQEADINPSSLLLKRSAQGKPYFADSPWQFSLSHSEGYVAAALSDEGPLGLDIEAKQPSAQQAIKLSARFFGESACLRVSQDPALFPRLWTQAEAEAKCLGIPLPLFLQKAKEALPRDPMLPLSPALQFQFFLIDKMPLTLCTSAQSSPVALDPRPFDSLF